MTASAHRADGRDGIRHDWGYHSLDSRVWCNEDIPRILQKPSPTVNLWSNHINEVPELALTPDKKPVMRGNHTDTSLSEANKRFERQPRTVHFSSSVDINMFSPDCTFDSSSLTLTSPEPLNQAKSSNQADSPGQVESPCQAESPSQAESPGQVESSSDTSPASYKPTIELKALTRQVGQKRDYDAAKYKPLKVQSKIPTVQTNYHRDCSPPRRLLRSPSPIPRETQIFLGNYNGKDEEELALRPVVSQPKVYNHWTDFPRHVRQLDSSDELSPQSFQTDSEEPIDVIAADLQPNPLKAISKTAKARKSEVQADPSLLRAPASLDSAINVLSQPEFNSTLRIKQEIHKTQSEEFHALDAVKEKLRVSSKCRDNLQKKLSSRLAPSDPAFVDLYHVDIKEEDIAPSSGKPKSEPKPRHKRQQPHLERPPDLMEFFSSRFQREAPSHHTTSVQRVRPQTSCVQRLRTLDLYKHLRAWEDVI